ncbi:MAG: hypothetical protein MUO72_17430 [Bacteroidales bacterium]|nr:hypothetical protein [Bacteroidales bacterium]
MHSIFFKNKLAQAFTRAGHFFGLDQKKKIKSADVTERRPAEVSPPAINRRRELLKGLAGAPFLAGFAGAFLKDLSEPRTDAVSGAPKVRVDYNYLPNLKGELPKGKLGNLEITRLIMGCNLISGYAHARDLVYANSLFKAYHTDEKTLETFRLAEMSGINTTFITNLNFPVFNKYLNLYGGKMQTICQTYLRANDFLGDIDKAIGNGAKTLYIQGGEADRYVREGNVKMLGTAIEYIKKKGYMAGIGAHALEVIKTCEVEALPVDFYVKTFHHDNYWSAHPESERVEFSVDAKRYADHNKIHDNMFDLFPEKTSEFMKEVKKPWIAFKVLAGGAIMPKEGFRFAFENGADFICVGMFDFQVVDDVNTATIILSDLKDRTRTWYS